MRALIILAMWSASAALMLTAIVKLYDVIPYLISLLKLARLINWPVAVVVFFSLLIIFTLTGTRNGKSF